MKRHPLSIDPKGGRIVGQVETADGSALRLGVQKDGRLAVHDTSGDLACDAILPGTAVKLAYDMVRGNRSVMSVKAMQALAVLIVAADMEARSDGAMGL
jgi:3-deoxy-D-arabino-heptulosonate 7-phosphate (DAHP) synthase